MTGRGRTNSGERLLIVAAVAVLVGGSAYDFYAFSSQPAAITEFSSATSSSTSNSSSTEYVTGTSVTETDIFFTTDCPLPTTAGGSLELRVVSDSSGLSVSVEYVNEINSDSCSNQTFSETQVVYVRTFTVGPGGWLYNNAYPGGLFTVVYEGRIYTFSGAAPPLGTNCLTLHVPSGNVTSAFTTNGCR